jgi:hypothetical protein
MTKTLETNYRTHHLVLIALNFDQLTLNHAQARGYKNIWWKEHFIDAIPKASKA